ncbi:MAG: 50S ribosomal protein L2 [Nitrososphaerota archaeon]|jgi:large subunit ribosomal protein L2|nr:50S ribosomal protein L2 [Nitrososphaerota archaeon]MDG6955642.1 50S ribosomal protein L2 [Nitrososphaerota archaeon]MDG6964270.1 50S ribosomal protein L2 [Nitrososphaerota archaeon]MDG6974389.1 50S ribosomal protein L2 [Nitrososphaerota archaeon]MDG6975505.1 50S ribosomal protein L2 [Nitrososphaerota archaeon]
MGKRILQRRRGKAGIQFRAPSRGKVAPVRYPRADYDGSATVTAILDERGRSAPLAQLKVSRDKYAYLPAVAGMSVGQQVSLGSVAAVHEGNVMPLSRIPEGTRICNVELRPGDGGKLVRASGASAVLFSKAGGRAILKLPSGKNVQIHDTCRATIGEVAGGGRKEKPFLTAGARHHAMRAAGRVYPRMRGIAMAVVYHPFGGGRHQHPGKSTSTSRNAPPGRKVGLIAPRKTGRKRLARTSMEIS